MPLNKLFESFEHRNNDAHFAAIVNISLSDGDINEKEKTTLSRFADKLDVSDEEFDYMFKNSEKHFINLTYSKEERLWRIFDLFKIIYADHYIDSDKENLIRQYAIGLGCTPENAKNVIKKSIEIFDGSLAFEDN